MGANAQTTVPTFTASQVLTADQMNQSARTGVPVFASTVTRDAAFGGTGEKTLAEGQMCYIEGTGFQTYNGTSWITWGAAPSSGAVVYLTGTTFSAQTTVALPNSTFSSTYDYYLVLMDAVADATQASVSLQVRDNTGAKTGAQYSGGSQNIRSAGTETNTGTSDQTSFPLQAVRPTDPRGFWQIFVANPASTTKFTKWSGTHVGDPTGATAPSATHFGGVYQVAEAHTGLTFTFSNASTGLYRVYAYVNS